MNNQELLDQLNSHLEEGGFVFEFRSGRYNRHKFEEYRKLILSIPIVEGLVDARIISLIWFVPSMLLNSLEFTKNRNEFPGEVEAAVDSLDMAFSEKFDGL